MPTPGVSSASSVPPLFCVNPYGTFRLDMDKRLDLGTAAAVPRPRNPADAARSTTEN
ncbi:hypothetical protein [Streptomyces nigrescens]|uniref:hypothetical protein n=1 Tax=Streptomyces nigrescens TaxID=1920 RepID=UPI00348FC7FE